MVSLSIVSVSMMRS
jgi:hypothetical protein